MEQEPYVIAEERRKTQGEKYRYKEDEENLVPEIFRLKKTKQYIKLQNSLMTWSKLLKVLESICVFSLVWASNNVFLPVKPDAEEVLEGGGRDAEAVQDRVSQEK